MDNNQVAAETKNYRKIPQIRSFEMNGKDVMDAEIEANYHAVKNDVLNIITSEMERIKNDPDLQHLIPEQ